MYNQLFKLQEEIFKALAHSRRLEIIHLLRNRALTVGEIYTMLDLPQANVSQHLQILKDRNIVTAYKNGKQVSYKLARPEYLKIADIIRELLIDQHKNHVEMDNLNINLFDVVPLVRDPVCGMRVSPKTAGYVYELKGDHYFFCASGCLEKFKSNSKKFIS